MEELNLTEKYLEALKRIDDWAIVSEWAVKVGELYPDVLEKANEDALNQARDTTGTREIAARISSAIVRGAYNNNIEIDASEKPRRVRFVSSEEHDVQIDREIEEDVAPLKRNEIARIARSNFSEYEEYRVEEFESISKMLKKFYQLDFEVDHSMALLNPDNPGEHHPDNLQLLLKSHNGKKSNKNWQRFSLDEQLEYIRAAIKLQEIIAPRMNIVCDNSILDSLLERLHRIYS